ncbi:MAG: hypothetical protein CME65_09740 [Halobacteriovoraceae bacterium]|nr:hypothetical protein [Halobacteriovoraceae bacterium]|tara:strand:+ start:4576 stop:5868 length:1293 start_codon:yes stop_codon:yes gene_type:complete
MITLENLPSLKIEVDNRNLDENSLFIAIVGLRFNPLEHLDTVVESGCKFVMCEIQYRELTRDFSNQIDFIFVEDITKSIQELAFKVANQFKDRGGKIIAISGSNGKTTTKEMLYHILDHTFPGETICTQKNNNNHLGVPFSLFQISTKTKFAIIELGSNHPGEIEVLCKIANPDLGVTTNIGATHLEFFDNLENVYKEEATLGHYAVTFFKNDDDPYLKNFNSQNKLLSFGQNGTHFKFLFPSLDSVSVNGKIIKNSNITGKHNLINLALAFSMANFLLPEQVDTLLKAASSFMPTANRSQWLDWKDKKVFLDAYNANPSSMKVAVEGFIDKVDDTEKALLILGDMNELGDNAAKFHESLGKYLGENFPKSRKVFIGNRAQEYAMGYQGDCDCFGSVQEASNRLNTIVQQVDYLFIKGSRSLQLETILDI